MGHYHSKKALSAVNDAIAAVEAPEAMAQSPWTSPFSPAGFNPSPARTPGGKLMEWSFSPPSLAKPIMEAIRRRRGRKINSEGGDRVVTLQQKQRVLNLNKDFGFLKNFREKYEVGKEVGRGHFGHTCLAKVEKGEVKGQFVAAKIISKAKLCLNN